jgi:hypothetical protein
VTKKLKIINSPPPFLLFHISTKIFNHQNENIIGLYTKTLTAVINIVGAASIVKNAFSPKRF